MLGPPTSRRLDAPLAVSLEALVPHDNFYRHLDAMLDLSFVRDWVRGCSAERGRPSLDPVIFCKLQLIMFFAGIRSERQLVTTASLNLAHRWYLGDALDEPLPDHSSLTRIRQRLGIATFERFFEQIVDLCQDAGLVWGKELFFDATKVQANADLDSLVPLFDHEAKTHVADLFASDDAAVPNAGDDLPAGLVRLPSAASGPSPTVGEPRWPLLQERRLNPHRPPYGSDHRTTAFRVSRTDPEATPMVTGSGTVLGDHDHDVVDGGKARIILAALVTPADVMEHVPMRDLLWRVCFRRQLRPHHVTGDTTYGTVEHSVALEDAGIRVYVPLPNVAQRTPCSDRSQFAYDADRDEDRCPPGASLPRWKTRPTREMIASRADPATWTACPVKPAWTASAQGRTVHRSSSADYLDKVRCDHRTLAYEKAIRKRKVWVEPLFAEAKAWHGLRRLRLRGLENANVEGVLVAAGQNLKRLLSHLGWGQRPWPNGAAGLLVPQCAPASPARG